jgi:hypothetical protein
LHRPLVMKYTCQIDAIDDICNVGRLLLTGILRNKIRRFKEVSKWLKE